MKHVSPDKFSQDVDLIGIDIGDAFDNSTWNHVYRRNGKCKEHAVDRQIYLVYFHHDNR